MGVSCAQELRRPQSRAREGVVDRTSAPGPSTEPRAGERGGSPLLMYVRTPPTGGLQAGPGRQSYFARGDGAPLPAPLRDDFEGRLGRDLGDVRLHSDDRAARLTESMNARALTLGRDVFFARGEFSPETRGGQRLLGHELVHVVQHGGRGSDSGAALEVSHPEDSSEREADRIADALLDRATPSVAGAIGTEARGVQRTCACGGTCADCVREQPAPGTVQRSADSSGSGGGGGKPGAGIPDCSAVMGGRQVEHWLAGDILGQNHTYVNFKMDAANYWLVEAGPLPSDPKKVGAWAKPGDWESRGNRIMSTYGGAEDCAKAKKCLFDVQSTYHSKTLAYDPTNGPNSNSFTEHLTHKCPVYGIFHKLFDHQWDYWRSHTRPF